MKAIQAKKEGLMRIGGMVLIIFGVILSIIFDAFVINSAILFTLILIIVISWFVLIILLKLEKDFFVDNAFKISIILIILTTIFIVIGFFVGSSVNSFVFTFLSISNVLIIIAWHFSLSIYKKQKILFIVGSIIFCSFTLIFRISSLIVQFGYFLSLTPLLLVVLGFCLIIIAELRMKKKGFLNYIL